VLLESNKYRQGMQFDRSKYWFPWFYTAISPTIDKAFNGEISLKEALAQAVEAGNKALAGLTEVAR